MPRFYFDIDDGERQVRDHDGIDMEDVQAARDEAISILPDIARQVLPDGDRREMKTIVRNADRQVVFRATLLLMAEWVHPEGHEGAMH